MPDVIFRAPHFLSHSFPSSHTFLFLHIFCLWNVNSPSLLISMCLCFPYPARLISPKCHFFSFHFPSSCKLSRATFLPHLSFLFSLPPRHLKVFFLRKNNIFLFDCSRPTFMSVACFFLFGMCCIFSSGEMIGSRFLRDCVTDLSCLDCGLVCVLFFLSSLFFFPLSPFFNKKRPTC